MTMREKAIAFGSNKSLVGIYTKANPTAAARPPGVILLNSGILHRIGASRLHVTIARMLAEMGFPVMRFDFSGIGDSEPRRDDLPFEESAPREVQDAMDRMEAIAGCQEFIIFGLCSGADVAFQVAPMDRRIIGLIQLDAVAYRTWKWYLNYYGPRALKSDVWMRFVKRVFGGGEKKVKQELDMETHALPTYVREFPPQEEFAKTLEVLAARKVKQLYVFTDGMYMDYNYRDQFREAFSAINFGDTLQVELWPKADHIFRGPDQQELLYATLKEWMAANWPEVKYVPAAEVDASQVA
jgi:pimeloyl-ACP methyl ester carboxylesterase